MTAGLKEYRREVGNKVQRAFVGLGRIEPVNPLVSNGLTILAIEHANLVNADEGQIRRSESLACLYGDYLRFAGD